MPNIVEDFYGMNIGDEYELASEGFLYTTKSMKYDFIFIISDGSQ